MAYLIILQALMVTWLWSTIREGLSGISVEADPGVYFQDDVSGDAFDIPGKTYVTFPLKKDKIFAIVGFGWGIYQDPVVAPGGGIIWLINDKLRFRLSFRSPRWCISQMTIGTYGCTRGT